MVSAIQEHVHKFSLRREITCILIRMAPTIANVHRKSNCRCSDHSRGAITDGSTLRRCKPAFLLNIRANEFEVAIEDEGKGFDLNLANRDARQHLGLLSMREKS